MEFGKWMSRCTNLFAFILGCATAGTSGLNAAEPGEHVVDTFDVARHGDCLLLPVTIGDHKCRFIVDTGSTGYVIDTTLESYLKPLEGDTTIGGEGRYKKYRLPAALLGNARLPLTGNALCLDLAPFREASGYDFRGIIGMSFLRSHVVCIDFDAGILSILKESPSSTGSGFRIGYNKFDQPLLDVEVGDGETVPSIIDTGMSGSLKLRKYIFDELVENGRLTQTGARALIATVKGDASWRQARLDELRIGDFRLECVNVNESERNAIGLGLLARYRVTLDFPNNRVYLEPGKRFAEPDRCGWCGLALGRVDGKTRVKDVGEGSAAAKAGVKAGDEILRVDEEDASSLTLFQMHSILESAGRQVRLDIKGSTGRRDVGILVSGPDDAKNRKGTTGATQH